ncbi:MAG: HAD-IA family hydrolase [Tepidisphaeraceae bacterium]
MESSGRIGLVVFDLGRVLIRICSDWQHAARVAQYGGSLPDVTPAFRDALHALVVQSETGAIDDPEFCRRCSALMGIEAEHINRMAEAYLLGPFDGIDRLIEDIAGLGVKTACLTNTNGNHWRQMTAPAGPNALPLHKLDYRFASHLVRLRKPDAAIYEHVERATGFSPAEILFFDDLPENIAAAAQRGWNAVRVTSADDPVGQMRDALRSHRLPL